MRFFFVNFFTFVSIFTCKIYTVDKNILLIFTKGHMGDKLIYYKSTIY